MTEMLDFVDVIKPLLEAGPWTNFGTTPKVIEIERNYKGQVRGNIKFRVEVSCIDADADNQDLTFDGSPIENSLVGTITVIHTDKAKKNLMKSDIPIIMKASGLPFSEPRISNKVPNLRNKHGTRFTYTIIDC